LLSKWPTPCDYAAKRSPDGAMFKFAFTFCKLEHMSILFQPHQKHTSTLILYPISRSSISSYHLGKERLYFKPNVFMVELRGTAPRSIYPLLTLTI
jgi:hypothetical protein